MCYSVYVVSMATIDRARFVGPACTVTRSQAEKA